MSAAADSDDHVSGTSKQRISHACEVCRAKRVRCTGERPACSRCVQLSLTCSYGFARGGRRKRFLAALDGQSERSDSSTKTAGREDDVGELEDLDDIDGTGEDETDDTYMTSFSPSDDSVMQTSPDVTAFSTTSSRPSVQASSPGATVTPERTTKTYSRGSVSSSSARKTRVSNACLECKRKRRKCSGNRPCELCISLNSECIYDPSQDRRSKAYFHQKVIDGVLGAMNSDNPEEVLALLRKNAHFDDVASGIQSAMSIAESSGAPPSILSKPIETNVAPLTSPLKAEVQPFVCESFCAIFPRGTRTMDWYSITQQEQQRNALRGPQHLILPLNVDDNSPLSRAFTNFRDGAKKMIGKNSPLSNMLGPLDPDVELLFRERTPSDAFTASSWACEFGRVFTTIDFYTQLANIFLLSRYMRWIIDPSFENYTMLPAIMRPTESQLSIPHHASADLWSMPEIRNALVKGRTSLIKTVGQHQPVRGIKLNWPYDLDKAVIINQMTGALTVSRLFGEFASDQNNWSCSMDFLETFPEVKGCLNVINHDHGWDGLEDR